MTNVWPGPDEPTSWQKKIATLCDKSPWPINPVVADNARKAIVHLCLHVDDPVLEPCQIGTISLVWSYWKGRASIDVGQYTVRYHLSASPYKIIQRTMTLGEFATQAANIGRQIKAEVTD